MQTRIDAMTLCRLLFVVCLGVFASMALADAAKPGQRWDAIVDAVVARYHLPGIAVGVIDHGEVVYIGTRGERIAGSGEPIDQNSLFKIASNSKAMTATVLARLVQQGKLRWDDPVQKHLPDFAMFDPWVSQHMQVGDLLVHRSGLPQGGGDLMLWPMPNAFSRADIIHGLRFIQPAYDFRAGYAYDNLLYVVAGELAAAVGDASYAELVRREIFQPLGMQRCQVGRWDRRAVGNVAMPHHWQGEQAVADVAAGDTVEPSTMEAAGGIRCSLSDMLIWAKNWLQPSAAQLQWLNAEQRRIEWTPYTPMPISERRRQWDGTRLYAYGYGWRIADVDGEMTYSHTGTLSGMYSTMFLLPERQAGFVVLMNTDASAAREVLIQTLTEAFTRPKQAPKVAYYADQIAAAAQQHQASQVPDTSARQPATHQSLTKQLGIWSSPWFGEVSICAKGEGVHFAAAKSPQLEGQVMQVGDRYLIQWTQEHAEAWLHFPAKADGELTLSKVDRGADFSYDYEDLRFTRNRACPQTILPGLETLMQRYEGEVPGASLLVLKDGKPIIKRSYGMGDLEAGIASTPETHYRLASVSKQFTAAAILLLAEDGVLQLDDPLRQWLPELPSATAAIRLDQVLSHSSGLIDYEELMPDDYAGQISDQGVLDILAKVDRLYFAPGSAYRYSNSGYVLLGLVIERASEKRLPEFLKQRIFDPLGMHSSLMYEAHHGPEVPNRAYGYSDIDGHWQRTDQSSTSATRGDGGIYSSIEDLALWDAARYDDRLLNAESRQRMFSPHARITGEPWQGDYAYGWRLTGATEWHSGETMGFRNVIVRWPAQRLTVIILSNRNDPEPYATALEIGRQLLDP